MRKVVLSFLTVLFCVGVLILNIVREHYIAANIIAVFVACDFGIFLYTLIVYIRNRRALK